MATQQGTAIKIGPGAFAYTNYEFQTWENETRADTEVIKDSAGNTYAVITSDPAVIQRGELIIKDDGALTPVAVDSTITLVPVEGTSTVYRVLSARKRFAVGAARFDLELIKETSMTYI